MSTDDIKAIIAKCNENQGQYDTDRLRQIEADEAYRKKHENARGMTVATNNAPRRTVRLPDDGSKIEL